MINWDYIRHIAGDMMDDSEYAPIPCRLPDGTLMWVVGVEGRDRSATLVLSNERPKDDE
jgi:hypothetical protein